VKYLLDTNVLSELLKPSPAPAVVEWMKQHAGEVAISALTIAEMAAGVEALPEGKRKSLLAKELRFLQEDYADVILPFNEAVAWEWARYCRELRTAGMEPPLIDSFIAATARTWGLQMVTRNGKDFPFVKISNPFSEDP
jgi:hypothetical protein